LLFVELKCCSSQRNLDPSIFDPSLATNLTLIIQGLIVLIVSTDVIALRVLRHARGLRRGRAAPPPAAPEEART
jgi:simple sugar transport system permease protein